MTEAPHPHHYTAEKKMHQRIIDWAVPIGLLAFYFLFYNFGKLSISEIIKTTGLESIALLSITLLVGPLARFVPKVNILKAHRKFWGITSFIFLTIHAGLVFMQYFDFSLVQLLDTSNPKYLGLMSGLLALLILFVVTISSNSSVIRSIKPDTWKLIQSTCFMALVFAVIHFFLMEQVDGVLMIKRTVGHVTYWFALTVVVFRTIAFLIPQKSHTS